MALSIPDGISGQPLAAVTVASPSTSTAVAWIVAAVAVLTLVLNVTTGFVNERRSRRAEAVTRVSELLDILDDCDERAVTAQDVAAVRRLRRPFERVAQLNRNVQVIGIVGTAINEVINVSEPPAVAQDRHQQLLGEAMGRLKQAADAAYLELNG